MTDVLIYRIYNKTGKMPHRHLGIVLATSAELALEKAKRNEWKSCDCKPEAETDHENWVAMA